MAITRIFLDYFKLSPWPRIDLDSLRFETHSLKMKMRAKKPLSEIDLYAPVKAVLEAQGYTVKSEIGNVDVIACRGDEPPVIVELKTGFSLKLFHQVVERLSVTDHVYMAVPYKSGRASSKALKHNLKLCRYLGVGLMTVRLPSNPMSKSAVQVHCDPKPYVPRKSKAKQIKLLKEFSKREGDPNQGGMTATTLVTAYRQDALRCLNYLHNKDAVKAAIIAKDLEIARTRNILSDNYYGWFERASRGHYRLSEKGRELSQKLN